MPVLRLDASSIERPDLGTIGALARLALVARRDGCHVELEDACAELRGLVALAGLAEILPCSGVEARR